MNNSDKIKYMEIEWLRFGKKYNKEIDRHALFSGFFKPIKQDDFVATIQTQIIASNVINCVDLSGIKTQRDLREYSRGKKAKFIKTLIDYYKDMIVKFEGTKITIDK